MVYDAVLKRIERLIPQLDYWNNEIKRNEIPDFLGIKLEVLANSLKKIHYEFSEQFIREYSDYFDKVETFYDECLNKDSILQNIQKITETFGLLSECLRKIEADVKNRISVCPCCGKRIDYLPLSRDYINMPKKYGRKELPVYETLSVENCMCPQCGATDRDRMIVSYLKKIGLPLADKETRVLQFAPAVAIDEWLKVVCTDIEYETTDLYMDRVTFKTDIQDMNNVENDTYDLIICSHVLEHVKDDEKALSELKRVLKPDGQLVFLVPINLASTEIDEEWGLSEEENWRRFGQDDHCREYSKQGLLDRLERYFYVRQLGRDFFGDDIFGNCGLTDTSILYVLTKNSDIELLLEDSALNKSNSISCNYVEDDYSVKSAYKNGGLVSVLMPTGDSPLLFIRSLESALNQTYENIEVIVSDHSFGDEIENVIRDYLELDSRVHYYCLKRDNKKNVWDKISEKARYINFLLEGDLFSQNKIEDMIDAFTKNENISLVTSSRKRIDKNGNVLPDIDETIVDVTSKLERDIAGYWILEKGINWVGDLSAVLFRREAALDDYPVWTKDEEHVNPEKLWLRLLEQGDMIYITDSLSFSLDNEKDEMTLFKEKVQNCIATAEVIKSAWDKRLFIENEDELCSVMDDWSSMAKDLIETKIVLGDVEIETLKNEIIKTVEGMKKWIVKIL